MTGECSKYNSCFFILITVPTSCSVSVIQRFGVTIGTQSSAGAADLGSNP